MKICIVHDWLTNLGGAERVVRYLCDIFPEAPIYTLVYDPQKLGDTFKDRKIITSYLQKFPLATKLYTKYLSFMPRAVESFDLREYDVVLSSSTCCAKGVITSKDTLHICYCATPMRYAWDLYHEYISGLNALSKYLAKRALHKIRIWDAVSANRVDYFIANSHNVKARINKHYRRNSTVIYPPADTNFFSLNTHKEDYYLIVSRLVPYKRIDIAVEAFNQLGKKLVIIGEGSQEKPLKAIAKQGIKFTGRLKDQEIRDYYSKAKAFIFTANEDCGITPMEAMSCGTPVIAYAKGGALETVVDQTTGIFFNQQTPHSLMECVERFEKMQFDYKAISQYAQKFNIDTFKKQIKDFVLECQKG